MTGPERVESHAAPDPPATGEPPASKPLPGPRWGLGDAALGMLVGVLLSSIAASIWLGASGRTELDLAGQAVSQAGLWGGFMAACLWASHRKGAGSLAVDFGLRMRPLDPVVGVVVGVAGQAGMVPLIALLLSPFLGRPDVSGPVNDLVKSSHGLGLAGLALFVIAGAPVFEELFFRGLLLRSMRRRMPDTAAIPLSAALFGLAHFQALPAAGLVVVITSLTALGVVLALLAVRTDRLGPGIWAHAAFNAFTVVVLALK